MSVLGPSELLVLEYNNLDREIGKRIIQCAKRFIKKKYGYSRSPELGAAGMVLNFWKSVLSSKQRQKTIPQATVRLAEKLAVPLITVNTMPRGTAKRQVRAAREELTAVQHNASQK
jgi:hypothetical protein